MKAYVELACWLDTSEPVTAGDLDRVTETFRVYLDACKGVPQMGFYVHGGSLCITASAGAGKSSPAADAVYIRNTITEALQEAGMEVS